MLDLVKRMAELFKALGDPTRLKIIRMLASNPGKTLCVADLAQRLGMTQPATSQHIRLLKQVGILEPDREGFRTFYSVNPEVLAKYKADVDELFTLAMTPFPCQTCDKGLACDKRDGKCPYYKG